MSRVGKQPVILPQGVDINILNNTILVKGKKGELKNSFPDTVKIVKEDNKLLVSHEIFKIKNYKIDIITRAKLPIKKTNNAEIIVFKFNNEPKDYFCILIGKVNNRSSSYLVPTVRIHSQCVTGDIFHSLKCDCGEQLNKSLDEECQYYLK